MSRFLDALAQHVLIYDGAMGTNIQRYQPTAEDYGGSATEGCNEYLVLTKPSVIEEIHRVDKMLVVELISTPGLLSYSSLELRDGSWCNLVLFNDNETKTHIKNSETHAYAAYQLSPRYYAWVRIHSGIMPAGLARNEMFLQKTRFYQFHGVHEKPATRELTYEGA